MRYLPDHPNCVRGGNIREHVYVMSTVIERPLIKGEVVHHIDNNSKNNSPDNLMLFASNADHILYHAKQAAFLACGNASFMKCPYCKSYDDPSNMYVRKNSYQAWHRKCANNYKAVKNPKTGPYRYLKERDSEYGLQ